MEITNKPQIWYNTLLYPGISQWLPKLANFEIYLRNLIINIDA